MPVAAVQEKAKDVVHSPEEFPSLNMEAQTAMQGKTKFGNDSKTSHTTDDSESSGNHLSEVSLKDCLFSLPNINEMDLLILKRLKKVYDSIAGWPRFTQGTRPTIR